MKKIIRYAALGFGILGIVLFGLLNHKGETAFAASGNVISSFRLNPESEELARISQGLAFDGTYLVYGDSYDWTTGFQPKIYKLTTGGSVASSFNAPAPDPPYHKGLAWDGSYVWVAIAGEKRIFKADGGNTYITTENDYPYGLTLYGGYFYEVDAKSSDVYKIDPKSGETVSSFSGPTPTDSKCFGLANDGAYLYISTYGRNDKIYKYTFGGSEVSSFDAPCDHPVGLAYDGTYLWCVDDELEYFYQFEK